MPGALLTSLIMGGLAFCFFYFLSDDKDWPDRDKAFAALKAAGVVFVLAAASFALFP